MLIHHSHEEENNTIVAATRIAVNRDTFLCPNINLRWCGTCDNSGNGIFITTLVQFTVLRLSINYGYVWSSIYVCFGF